MRPGASPLVSRRFALATGLVLLLSACAGSGYQLVPNPVQAGSAEPGARCRVYVAREDVVAGSIRKVRVFDGDAEIGLIREGEFLCWDRSPERGVGRVIFEGLGPDLKAVENVFDLPREAGSTSWFAIRILQQGHRPEIASLAPEEGRALIAAREPAPQR